MSTITESLGWLGHVFADGDAAGAKDLHSPQNVARGILALSWGAAMFYVAYFAGQFYDQTSDRASEGSRPVHLRPKYMVPQSTYWISKCVFIALSCLFLILGTLGFSINDNGANVARLGELVSSEKITAFVLANPPLLVALCITGILPWIPVKGFSLAGLRSLIQSRFEIPSSLKTLQDGIMNRRYDLSDKQLRQLKRDYPEIEETDFDGSRGTPLMDLSRTAHVVKILRVIYVKNEHGDEDGVVYLPEATANIIQLGEEFDATWRQCQIELKHNGKIAEATAKRIKNYQQESALLLAATFLNSSKTKTDAIMKIREATGIALRYDGLPGNPIYQIAGIGVIFALVATVVLGFFITPIFGPTSVNRQPFNSLLIAAFVTTLVFFPMMLTASLRYHFSQYWPYRTKVSRHNFSLYIVASVLSTLIGGLILLGGCYGLRNAWGLEHWDQNIWYAGFSGTIGFIAASASDQPRAFWRPDYKRDVASGCILKGLGAAGAGLLAGVVGFFFSKNDPDGEVLRVNLDLVFPVLIVSGSCLIISAMINYIYVYHYRFERRAEELLFVSRKLLRIITPQNTIEEDAQAIWTSRRETFSKRQIAYLQELGLITPDLTLDLDRLSKQLN